MDNTPDTPVVSIIKSSDNRDGNYRQLSEQAAVLLSSMQTETQSLETSETMLILMVLLESITANTSSGDVIWLSQYAAANKCKTLGIDEDTIRKVMERFSVFSSTIRKSNPFSF